MESSEGNSRLYEVCGKLFTATEAFGETQHADEDLFDLFICSDFKDEGETADSLEKHRSNEVVSETREHTTPMRTGHSSIHTTGRSHSVKEEKESQKESNDTSFSITETNSFFPSNISGVCKRIFQRHYLESHGIKTSNEEVKTDNVKWEDKLKSAENIYQIEKSTMFERSTEVRTLTSRKKAYQCKLCSKSFSESKDLNVHLLTHKSLRGRIRKFPEGSIQGIWIHSAEKYPEYKQYGKASAVKSRFTRRHRARYEEKTLKYDQCDRVFTQKCALTVHLGTHGGEKPCQCDQCDKTFTDKSNLRNHLTIHTGEKPFQCDQCDKAFTKKHSLIRHLRAHSGEKPFKCDQCEKAFTQKCTLINHLKTHSGDKSFQCDQCDTAFALKCSLTQHLRTHSAEKPFQCHQCDKAFTQKNDLTRHLRTHSGEKPFQCVQCENAFARKGTLKKHLRTHSGEKPFKCHQCDVAFAVKCSLTVHLRTHSGEKPFQCVKCDKAFARKSTLKTHLKHTVEKNLFNMTRQKKLTKHCGDKPFQCDQYK